jgi:hypothetical protein
MKAQAMEHHFPLEFDTDFYRSIHADLWNHNAAALVDHYETFGRSEGRRATPAVPREEFLALFPSGVPTLEIGPFNNPIATGDNVRYFDVLDKEGLIERAKRLGFGCQNVPHIDYVHPAGDLSIISDRFAVVTSSHLVEHQPDVVRHLAQVSSLLNDEGLYFCMIPDKRYCFDHFIAESSIADVLEAHLSDRTVHALGSVIEHAALVTHNDPLRHWNADHGSLQNDPNRVKAAILEFQTSQRRYIDVHAWQFTPSSFKAIINMLVTLRYIDFTPIRVYDTPFGSNEFYVILEKKSGVGGPTRTVG